MLNLCSRVQIAGASAVATASGPNGSSGVDQDGSRSGTTAATVEKAATTKNLKAKAEGKKKTSKVWTHFTEIIAEEKVGDKVVKNVTAECKICKKVLEAGSKHGTSRLWNHFKAKHEVSQNQAQLNQTTLGGDVNLNTWKYDEDASVEKYHIAIIMHEYPFNFSEHEYTNDFIRSLCPSFPIKRRKTTRSRIMDIFRKEKLKIFDKLSSLKCRFSCTMDLWTSNQHKGYLCVTCHIIDNDWKIQKHIINFMHLQGRHTGANLSTAYMGDMAGWNIENKLFALTLDNAASNDVCVDTVISTLKNHDSLLCDGKFFHVRCAAHIINLIARDGVSMIASTIDNIRASVLIVKSSPQQLEIFMKHATDMGLCTKKGLSQDVSTRWNSTYLMLVAAMHYKQVFQRLAILNPVKYRKCAPSKDDWHKASVVCSCLKIFYNVTKLLSGSYYPTANLFFVEFSEINIQLIEWMNAKGKNNSFIAAMAKARKENFDKYWEMSNVALAVACMLDPRYKMKVVEFYYKQMSDNSGVEEIAAFREVVQELYDSYASLYNPTIGIGEPSSEASHLHMNVNIEPQKKKLSAFLNEISEVDQDKSDLEKYCSASLVRWPEGEYFDILSWWKTHGSQYPILTMVARDVLAIPASTVASESAFSAAGRVVDKYRSRLDPEVVEALICTKDWIRASREGTQVKNK